MTREQGLSTSVKDLDLLTSQEEINLVKKLHEFEYEMLYSAENFESHQITAYLEELAASFHRFYTQCRILGSEKSLAEARLALCVAVKNVLKNGMQILGVDAPDKM